MGEAGLTQGERKELFLIALELQNGNVKATCGVAGVGRETYYRWMKDEHFAAACSIVREGLIDWVESKLVRNIDDGSSRDIQFYLRTQARHRGYAETGRIEVGIPQGGIPQSGIPDGVGYPPEPQTVEEWERQVGQARQARSGVAGEPQPPEPVKPVALLPAPAQVSTDENEPEDGDTPPG